MELFRRRYLCFISSLFIFASLLVFKLSLSVKLALTVALAVALVAAFLLFALGKKRRFVFLVLLLSVASLFLALAHSFLFVSLPAKRAQKYTGEFLAELEIISLEYSDGESAEYSARLLRAGEDFPNLKTHLVCDFPSDFSTSDRIIASVCSESISYKGGFADRDSLLMLRADADEPILYAEEQRFSFFSLDGIKGAAAEIRESFTEYVDSVFGEDSALVRGMLVNDKSELSVRTKAQFGRAGAAHVLAVSGLHVSLLLGALELLLRKLRAPKTARIALLSLSGIFLLALTDFSPSAVRSVLMLFAVYVNYLFAEESDAPTSLFVAVAIIILFSPFSVTDVGMWMSFCATLGLVCVFPVFERKIPRPNKRRGAVGLLLRVLNLSLKAMLITVVANIFTLPIMFYCFGYISLAAIPCNLILTPLTAIFLPLCVVTLIFGRIAIVGEALLMLSRGVSSLILGTVGFFADIRGAALSLEYPFAPLLVILLTLSMGALMVIKLRKKLLIALPPIAFALSFAVCLGVFAATDKEQIRYVGWGENEIFFIEKAGVSSVCDVSEGNASAYNLLCDGLCDYSLEIENYVLTHPHEHHPTMLRRLCENKVVRRFYLPLLSDTESLSLLSEIRTALAEYGTEIIFYERGEEIELSDTLVLLPCFEESDESAEIFLKIRAKSDVITYTDEAENDLAFALGANSRYFLIGAHGKASDDNEPSIRIESGARLIFADEKVAASSRVERNGEAAYVLGRGGGRRELLIIP